MSEADICLFCFSFSPLPPKNLLCVLSPVFFFGDICSRVLLPIQISVGYYSDPARRGYLADPDAIAEHRLLLAQKYGYSLPDLNQDPDKDMLLARKDPAQCFAGLEPGWVVNLREKQIYRVRNREVLQYYQQQS